MLHSANNIIVFPIESVGIILTAKMAWDHFWLSEMFCTDHFWPSKSVHVGSILAEGDRFWQLGFARNGPGGPNMAAKTSPGGPFLGRTDFAMSHCIYICCLRCSRTQHCSSEIAQSRLGEAQRMRRCSCVDRHARVSEIECVWDPGGHYGAGQTRSGQQGVRQCSQESLLGYHMIAPHVPQLALGL